MGASPTRVWPRLLMSTALLVVVLALAECVTRIVMIWHPLVPPPVLKEQKHCAYDERLGWRNLPGVHRPDMYGPGRSLTNNARGFRSLEEHSAEVPPGRTRVVCLGDSFTLGFGVDDQDTYPAQMQRLCPQVQAVNMGLGGYGLGQDYLWYQSDGAALATDVLVFVFIDADMNRLAMDEFGGFPKPRLDLEDGELVVRNVPVPRRFEAEGSAEAREGWFDRLALVRLARERAAPVARVPPSPEEWRHTLDVAGAIMSALARQSAERGQHFLMVYLPKGQRASRRASAVAAWAARCSAASGIPLIDVGAAFRELPPEELARMFLPNRHLSEEGNALVARLLLHELAESIEGFPACFD